MARRAPRAAARVRDDRRRGRVGPRVAGEARGRPLGRHPLARRRTAGASASPVQVAIFNMEYARSRALQPINRVGINLAGPDAARARHRRAEGALAAARSSPPTRSGASCSASPTRAPTSRRCQTRADAASTTAGCSRGRRCGRPTRSSRGGASASRAPIPTRRSTRASRYLVVDMQAPGHRGAAARADHRRRRVQRGVLRRGVRARRPSRRRAAQRLGGREHDARARAGHRVPVQGAGRARGVPRRALAARGRTRRCSTTSRSPTRSRSRSSSCACCGCTTGARCRVSPKGIEPGPESSITKLRVDRHDPSTCRTPRSTSSGRPRRCGGARRQSRRRVLAAAVAVVEGGVDRGRHLGGAAHDHRRADARPPALAPARSEAPRACRRMKVTGFDHVVFRVADIEASLAFYCGELGLEPVRVEEWRRGRGAVPVGADRRDDAHRPLPEQRG